MKTETKASHFPAAGGSGSSAAQPLQDPKGQGAGAGAATGRFNHRAVQVGVVAPHHRQGYPGSLAWRSALTGTLGFIGSWLAKAGLNSHSDSHVGTYEPHAGHWPTHLASSAGAALLPLAYDAVAHVVRGMSESAFVQSHPDQEVNRLVQLAIDAKPLTLAGLQAQVVKLQAALGDRPQLLAQALARMAQAVQTRPDAGCMGCCVEGLAQFNYLLGQLCTLRTQIGADEFDDALARMARHLPSTPALDAAQVKDLATPLLQAHDLQRPPGGAEATAIHADFMLALCSAPAFAHHPQVVRDAAQRQLHLNAQSLHAAQPQYPQRDQKDGKHAATVDRAIGHFLAPFAVEGHQASATQIDDLMAVVCRAEDRGLTPSQIQNVNTQLRESKGDTPAEAHAKARARILLNHWPDSQRGAGTQASAAARPNSMAAAALERALAERGEERDWDAAPCSQREALAYLAARNPSNQPLQDLARDVTDTRAVVAQLHATPRERLHAELGFAVGIALHKDKPSDRAAALLAMADGVRERHDLGRGALLPGLLPPQAVRHLAMQIRDEEGTDKAAKAGLIARLPQLCQLQATAGLARSTDRILQGLQDAEFNTVDTRRQAERRVNERLVPTALDTLTPASLHQPWLAPGAQLEAVVEVDELGPAPTAVEFASPEKPAGGAGDQANGH